MDIEKRAGLGKQADLETAIRQGFDAVNNLETGAAVTHEKIESAQSIRSKIVNYEKSRIIAVTATRIEQALSFLTQRLSEIGPDPEP